MAGGGSVGWLSLSGLGVPLGTVSTIASVVGVDASASALADEPPVAFGAFATSLSLPAASLSVAGVVAHHCHHAVCISDHRCGRRKAETISVGRARLRPAQQAKSGKGACENRMREATHSGGGVARGLRSTLRPFCPAPSLGSAETLHAI